MERTPLFKKIDNKEFVVSVQIDPPEGPSIDILEKSLAQLIRAGVNTVDVNSSRRVSLDSVSLAIELKRTGLDVVIPHLTTRESTAIGLQKQVMTGYSLAEICDYLLIAGDPYAKLQSQAPGIYEVGIVEGIDELSSELRDRRQLSVSFGAAINQYRGDKSTEVKLIMAKQTAGVDFFMSQPVFDDDQVETLLDLQERYIRGPLLVGIWPILHVRTLENIKNGRINGVVIPDKVYDTGKRLIDQELKLKKWGAQRAGDLIDKLRKSGKVAGVYVVSPDRDPSQLTDLMVRVLT